MGFVIWRTDQGGGWVSTPGSRSSYTHRLQHARVYATRAAAELGACGNEIVQEIGEAMHR